MNIKKLASLLFRRSVIVALLIFLQAAMLLLYMLWFSSDFIYVYWGCVVLSILAVLIIVSRQTDPGYKIAWIVPILLAPVFGGLVYLLSGGNQLSARMRRKMEGMDRRLAEVLSDDCKAGVLEEKHGADAANQSRYLERYAHCPLYANTGAKYYPLGDDVFADMLEALRGDREKLQDHLCYLTKTKDGKILKSTTIYIRNDDGTPIGIFGINYDITLMLAMENMLRQFTATEKESREPEAISRNVSDLLDELIEQSVKLVGKPVALMHKEDKVKAIQFLNETGAFLITKSGDRVCKYFGISKYTLYSYIDESKE